MLLCSIVYIRYCDHVLFRNADPEAYEPAVREAVGWLKKENEHAIWIVWERPVKPVPHEKIYPEQSGLVILKSDIMEIKRIG